MNFKALLSLLPLAGIVFAAEIPNLRRAILRDTECSGCLCII